MTAGEIRAEIQKMAEPAYAAFSSGLLPGTENILGVRLPKLWALAKTLAREGEPALETLFAAAPESFEETMLCGMLVGAVKLPDEKRLWWIERFIPRVDNWSVCDRFCCGLRAVGRNRPFYRPLVEKLLDTGEEYPVRTGLVLMLDWYLVPEEIGWALDRLRAFSHPGYYARMGAAWCGSIAYIHFPCEMEAFLRENTLDPFTHNKTIQKICESRRVDGETRAKLRALKR